MNVTTAEAAGRRSRATFRFSARDLVNVAIFAVIFIIVSYAVGMIGIISPLTWLLIVPVSIVANGVPFMLFVTRVRHPGMVTLFGLVVGLFFLLSGNTLVSTVGIGVVAVLAELVLWAGRYRSRWAAIWAYTIFSLGFFTPFLPLLYDREGYFSSPGWTAMGEEYVRASDALLTGPVLGGLALAIVVAGFVGALVGSSILRKHFVRAGLA